MHFFKNPGIAKKLVGAVIGLTIIVFGAVGLVLVQNQKAGFDDLLEQTTKVMDEFALQQQNANAEAEQLKAEQLLILMARIAPEPIINFELSALADYGEIAIKDSDISFVEFQNKEGQRLARSESKNIDSEIDIITRDVVIEEEVIGYVILGHNDIRLDELASQVNTNKKIKLQDMTEVTSSIIKSNSEILMAMMLTGAFVITIVSSGLISRMVVRPVKESLSFANKIASGDLSASVSPKSKDEIGQMLDALNGMAKSLREIVGQVRAGAEHIVDSSTNITHSTSSLTTKTCNQASSLEETSSSMEEMTVTVKQTADRANSARSIAVKNREQAEIGGKSTDDMLKAMLEINDASESIAAITSTIDGIAFQTNLLALNAAIEAASAGSHGRGFAVVAAEVRELAKRSSNASKEIRQLIENNISKIEAGTDLAKRSGEILVELVETGRTVADIIDEISVSSKEQAAGIDQVNTAIMQMDQITQDNANLVEEVNSSGKEMQGQAEQLLSMVQYFKISKATDNTGHDRSTDTPYNMTKNGSIKEIDYSNPIPEDEQMAIASNS